MNVIQLTPGTGKSVIAINQAISKNCPVVVPTEAHKDRLYKLADKLWRAEKNVARSWDLQSIEIITIEEFLSKVEEGEYENADLVFDDFDEMIRLRLGINPSRVTITTS